VGLSLFSKGSAEELDNSTVAQ